MKNKMLKKGLAIGMSAFLLASSLAPVSVQAASWKQNKTGWWWQEDNGSYPVSQWKVINGKWYAFDERGYMRSGWFLSNGKWYYLGAANDGSMKTGWQLVNGSWYYMNPGNGDMAANQWIGNYYVGGSGAMLTNQWIGNYYVDESGKWVPGKTKATAQWILSGNRWWYRHADGGYTRNGWERINGSWYYFDNAGWMLSNQWIGNYYVGGSGAMLTDTWIGDYYVDGFGKWVPGATKDQHTHKWLTETTVITYPEEGHWEVTTIEPAEGYWIDIEYPEEGHIEKTLISEEVGHTVHHNAEGEYRTVHHDAVTHTEIRVICGMCGADMGKTNESIEEHVMYHANRGEAIAYADKVVTIVDKEAYDEETWVETKAAWDEYIVDKEAVYDEKYVIDKEAYTERAWVETKPCVRGTVWVVDKPSRTEKTTKTICTICGITK